MTCSVLILGAPPTVGCTPGKTWRAAALYVGERLSDRFGAALRFDYVDLFSTEMQGHPELERLITAGNALPLVLIDGDLRFSGGKLNVTAIERAIAEAITRSAAHPAPQEEPAR